jgi:hypothetical protein
LSFRSIKISRQLNYSRDEIETLLQREGLEQRFRLSCTHDRKLGSTCQVYYAYDLWHDNQQLVALKLIQADFIDTFVSYDDYLTLKQTKNVFYRPQHVIYNGRLSSDKNYVPIEQYIGELGRLCPYLPISRCIENGAKRLATINAYLIAFEYIPGRTVWENLVRTDFTFLNEYQARRFVRLFIEKLLVLLKHGIIHCDLNGCQNYYYRLYDDICSMTINYGQWSSNDDVNKDELCMSDDSRQSSMDDLAFVPSMSSPLTFIDFGWSICTADVDDDRNDILLQTLQNLFERTPRIVQVFADRHYWDFRQTIERRQLGLKQLLYHPWLIIDDEISVQHEISSPW